MSTIVTRAAKGSPLTHTEVDANFTNLNTDKYQSGANALFTSVALDAPTTDATLTIDTGITSWVYSGKTVSVSGQESNPTGLFIRANGTKMYICGSTGDDVNEYTLGTAWDVSTATFTAVSTGVTQDTAPNDVFFKDDGLTMFMLGGTNDTVYQYTLSVAWDITTATYASKSFSVTTQESAPTGMWFKSDGTTMYIIGTTNDTVYQYTLSTPWDISTASYASISFSVASQDSNPQQVNLSADGTKMWVLGATGDDINEYTLGTAWNVSTATFVNNVYIGFQETNPTGLFIDSTAANRVYVTGNLTDAVYQYNTATNTIDATTDRLFVSGETYANGNFYASGSAVVGVGITAGTGTFGTTSVSGTLTATSTLTLGGSTTGTANFGNSITTANISMGTGQTTGTLTLGGTATTGTLTVGQSTGAQTLNLGTGATTNGTTKAVNIGTAGVSGSTTTINIGSAVSGALGNISMGNSGTQFLVAPTTSAVNYVQVTGNATTSRPVISAQGSDANIGLQIASKGNRSISLLTNSVTSLDVLSPASGVNYFTLNGSITNLSPSIVSTGTDTNIGLNLTTKGTGALSVNTGGGEQVRILDTASTDSYIQLRGGSSATGGVYVTAAGTARNLYISSGVGNPIRFFTGGEGTIEQMRVAHTASAVNYVQVTGSATTAVPVISSQGSDTNISLFIASKGTGTIRLSTNSTANTQVRVTNTPSAVNFIDLTGGATGSPVTISASAGSLDTNIDMNLTTKGTGAVNLNTGGGTQVKVLDVASADNPWLITGGRAGVQGNRITGLAPAIQSTDSASIGFRTNAGTSGGLGTEQLRVAHTTSVVNYVQVTGAVTGGGPIISTQGSDTNAELRLRSKGIFNVLVQNGAGHNGLIVDFTSGATTANYFQMYAKVAGSSPSLAVLGTDTNIDLALTPKGTGLVSFGTHTATALTISGYVEIKDSGGTIRKLAVVT